MGLDPEVVRAMLNQALAEARSRGASRITEMYLTMYDVSPEAEQALRNALEKLAAHTPAEKAQVITSRAPSRYICWNCCGLRFESDDPDGVCPNCGHTALRVPSEIVFALHHIEVAF